MIDRLKEKITLILCDGNPYACDAYVVSALTNRLSPDIGKSLTKADVEKLLQEAVDSGGNLTIKIK